MFGTYCDQHTDHCAGNGFKACFEYDETKYEDIYEFYSTFPVISFYFSYEKYEWYPEYYLQNPLNSDTTYCVKVLSLDRVILGSVFMRDYDIEFDQSNKRLRFIRSNCDLQSELTDEVEGKMKGKPSKPKPEPTPEPQSEMKPEAAAEPASKEEPVKKTDDDIMSKKETEQLFGEDTDLPRPETQEAARNRTDLLINQKPTPTSNTDNKITVHGLLTLLTISAILLLIIVYQYLKLSQTRLQNIVRNEVELRHIHSN